MHCSGKSHAKKLKIHELLGVNVNEDSNETPKSNVVNIDSSFNPITYGDNATYR